MNRADEDAKSFLMPSVVHIPVHIETFASSVAAIVIDWRRRPDLNRGWRFCSFNGVVNRVVLCWSLVGLASPLCLVFGHYWTTSGLRHGLRGFLGPSRPPEPHRPEC